MILCDGAVDLRLGRWQDVLADVDACDAVITDPPYSARTHEGHNEGEEQMRSATGQATRTALAYQHLDESGAHEIVGSWSGRTRGWLAIFTSHDLGPAFSSALEMCDRYVFAPLPVIQKRPRLLGDGPANWAVWLVVSRPRTVEFSRWGCLPGLYEAPTSRAVAGVAGQKPLGLMRAIVRDYTRPGDLVVDPFCGGGTTALACAMEGRRCITSEVDPETFEKARARLARGVQRSML